jgi:hypothetical protein
MCQVLKESLDIVICPWSPPLPYLLHFISIGMYSSVVDDMTEALHLFWVEVHLFLAEKRWFLRSLSMTMPRCLSCSSIEHENMKMLSMYTWMNQPMCHEMGREFLVSSMSSIQPHWATHIPEPYGWIRGAYMVLWALFYCSTICIHMLHTWTLFSYPYHHQFSLRLFPWPFYIISLLYSEHKPLTTYCMYKCSS